VNTEIFLFVVRLYKISPWLSDVLPDMMNPAPVDRLTASGKAAASRQGQRNRDYPCRLTKTLFLR